MRRPYIVGAALSCAVPLLAQAADHIDAPAATAEPTADITDVFAWMNEDADRLNLVLNVHHMATAESRFSPAVQYALHVNSSASFGAAATEEIVLCQFYSQTELECWLGDEYVVGDPSAAEGIQSEGGGLRVFAGRRDDPFFFELLGFRQVVSTVQSVAGSLDFDMEGCPTVDQETSTALVTQLQSGPDGAPASNTFAGNSVLSLVVQVDKALVTAGGPIVGVWASTHSSAD
nr:hypothetical protein [uncultured bacterium]ANY58035.1 hypothetical protein [uncultured bacterium]